jgi:hypothetical protein
VILVANTIVELLQEGLSVKTGVFSC